MEDATMEASIAHMGPETEQSEDSPPTELLQWWAEIERDLPAGDGLTDQELRIDRLLELIAEEKGAIRRVEDFTAKRVAMVEDHAEREVSRHQRRIMHMEARIALNLPPSPKGFEEVYGKKSQSFPHGDVGFRTSPETVTVAQPAVALEFAKANGIPVITEEKVAKKDLHAHFKKTGEVPEGCEVVPGKPSFFVKPREV